MTNIVDETDKYSKTDFLKKCFISKLSVSQDGLLISDLNEKGAPTIERYVEYNFPDGYNYIIILNKDTQAVYKEHQKFDQLNG